MTEGCGRLPTVEELPTKLLASGSRRVRMRSLVPGDRDYAVVAET